MKKASTIWTDRSVAEIDRVNLNAKYRIRQAERRQRKAQADKAKPSDGERVSKPAQ